MIILAVILVIIVIIVIVLLTKKKKAENSESSVDEGTGLNNILKYSGVYKDESFPLKVYMKGANSLRLQKELNRRGAGIAEDSYFGTKTADALLKIFNI